MRLPGQIILPLVAASTLLLAEVLLRPLPPVEGLDDILIGVALLFLLIALVQWYTHVRRPWQRIRSLYDRAGGAHWSRAPIDLSDLADGIERLQNSHEALQRQLEVQTLGRQAAEHALHRSEERYQVAVRGASEGLWEWNLQSGEVYFSPLWKSLLGYEDRELGNRIEEWHDRIHPEDLPGVLGAMESHLSGRTPRFESQHRLLHRDQSWHWVYARGTAFRHASGVPYQVVGLHSDITARRAAEQTLLEVTDSLANARGEPCFQIVARGFARVMGVREAFVCEPCDHPPTRARMLAWWCDGQFLDNVEYELEGTPCKNPEVLGRVCYCSKDLEEQWPLEKPFNRTAYLGIPIHDSSGTVIGHIACTDNKPMPDRAPHLAIFKLFAERAGLELERRAAFGVRADLGHPQAHHSGSENSRSALRS